MDYIEARKRLRLQAQERRRNRIYGAVAILIFFAAVFLISITYWYTAAGLVQ